MRKEDRKYAAFVQILNEELLPAMGCTEPIAVAYASARARAVLGVLPDRCELVVSGNIIKNVKSVVVPNTGGLKGLEASVAAGVVAGNADAVLEVVASITQEQKPGIRAFMETHEIRVTPFTGDIVFYIKVTLYAGAESASVTITNFHTNIIEITKNGEAVFTASPDEGAGKGMTDRSCLDVESIIDFADTVDLDDVRSVIGRQIEYNSAISAEGLTGDWGAQIGKVLLRAGGSDYKARVKAAAAAGSDARMSGCEKPVVIVSGSGNQGMTASLPVIEYARVIGASEDMLMRALVVSDLITIHQKTGIGRLSAFCGATSAGCGAASGIAYLDGERYDAISHTIVNALAILAGMVCDGAKPSCAGKIAAAVDAGLMGYEMYKNGQQFYDGDGIVKKGVDRTIAEVGRMAREGMRETDKEILHIMVEK